MPPQTFRRHAIHGVVRGRHDLRDPRLESPRADLLDYVQIAIGVVDSKPIICALKTLEVQHLRAVDLDDLRELGGALPLRSVVDKVATLDDDLLDLTHFRPFLLIALVVFVLLCRASQPTASRATPY